MRDSGSGAGWTSGTWILLIATAGICGGLAGAAASALAGGRDTASASPSDAGLTTAIRQLTEQVAGLHAALAQRPLIGSAVSTTSAASAPAQPAEPAALVARPDIETLLQSLAATLREQAAAGGSAPALVIPPLDPARRENVFKLLDQDHDVSTRAHLFWSEQKLLDAYGPPDAVEYYSDAENWLYKPDVAGRFVSFTVRNGRVTRVNSH